MNIDQAREHLTRLFKPEYHRYIRTQLAGDFAVILVKEFEKKNNKQIQFDKKLSNFSCKCGWLHLKVNPGFRCKCGEVFDD